LKEGTLSLRKRTLKGDEGTYTENKANNLNKTLWRWTTSITFAVKSVNYKPKSPPIPNDDKIHLL
jgi:hypothetical protein